MKIGMQTWGSHGDVRPFLALAEGLQAAGHEATLAGKPSIVIAHIGEQEYWGTELRRRGIAGKTLWRRRVTAAALARRIGEVLAAPGMAAKAREIGAAMKQEQGVAEAVRIITAHFGGGDCARAA